jgi:hypothetical protein
MYSRVLVGIAKLFFVAFIFGAILWIILWMIAIIIGSFAVDMLGMTLDQIPDTAGVHLNRHDKECSLLGQRLLSWATLIFLPILLAVFTLDEATKSNMNEKESE